MPRNERTSDGFWSKVLVASIVVIWVSLVAGNWLGNYAIEQGLFGKGGESTEFKDMPDARPRPWMKADRAEQLQEEIDKQRAKLTGAPKKPEPKETVTASPIPVKEVEAKKPEPKPEPSSEPVAEPTPVSLAEPEPKPEPESTPVSAAPPAPTPEAATGPVELQFGSFANEDNAKELMAELEAKGQSARIEPIATEGGTVYRVRSNGYDGEEAAKAQAEKLKEQGIDAFLVNP